MPVAIVLLAIVAVSLPAVARAQDDDGWVSTYSVEEARRNRGELKQEAPAPATAATQPEPQTPAQYSPGQLFDLFSRTLTPYGRWEQHPRFGWIWIPRERAEWRPYSNGHWAWTDWGWAFVSDAPYAWAVYHYGRWTFEPAVGWAWIPGYEWSGGWVTFLETDSYVGWSALGPDGAVSDYWYVSGAVTPWVWVPFDAFGTGREPQATLPAADSQPVFQSASPPESIGSEAVLRPSFRKVHRAEPVKVHEASTPSAASGSGSLGLSFFRPRVAGAPASVHRGEPALGRPVQALPPAGEPQPARSHAGRPVSAPPPPVYAPPAPAPEQQKKKEKTHGASMPMATPRF